MEKFNKAVAELFVYGQTEINTKEIQKEIENIMSTEIVKTPFETTVTQYESSIKNLLKESDIPFEYFTTKVKLAFAKNPKLNDCFKTAEGTQELYGAILTCAGLGFVPNDVNQFCYLIPLDSSKDVMGEDGFMKKTTYPSCRLEIGYQGWLELLYRTGLASFVYGTFIDESEMSSLKITGGINRNIYWEVNPIGNKDKPIGFYVEIKLTDGNIIWDYLTKEQVKTLRMTNKFAYQGKIKDPMFNMEIKTVLKQLIKFLAKSIKENRFMELALNGDNGNKLIAEKNGEITVEVVEQNESSSGLIQTLEQMESENKVEEKIEVAVQVTEPNGLTEQQISTLFELSEIECIKNYTTTKGVQLTFANIQILAKEIGFDEMEKQLLKIKKNAENNEK